MSARSAVMVIGVVALATACSGPPGASTARQSASAAGPSTVPSTAAPLPSATPGPTGPGDLPPCDPQVLSGVDATVTGQLTAFADGDFRSALSFASDSFRSSVTLAEFRRIIQKGYPDVADARAHEVRDCRQLGDTTAQALISVTGRQGTTSELGYRFVRQSEGWRIDGATVLSRAEAQVA